MKITIFDSGLGGLSVLRHLLPYYPAGCLHYYADAANAPYGEKSSEWVKDRLHKLIQHWQIQGSTGLVIACNTATAAAIESLRSAYPDFPIIGIEPGLKPAAQLTENQKVGVLATRLTLSSQRFKDLHEQIYEKYTETAWTLLVASGLVEAIESDKIGTDETQTLIAEYCGVFKKAGVDTVVLGCTHFSFIADHIREHLPSVRLIDTGEAVAAQVRRRIPAQDLPLQSTDAVQYETSGDQSILEAAVMRWVMPLHVTAEASSTNAAEQQRVV